MIKITRLGISIAFVVESGRGGGGHTAALTYAASAASALGHTTLPKVEWTLQVLDNG
jgi:transcriptional regulator CtsR